MKMNSISACHSQRPEQYRGFLRKLAIIQKRINLKKESPFLRTDLTILWFWPISKKLLSKIDKNLQLKTHRTRISALEPDFSHVLILSKVEEKILNFYQMDDIDRSRLLIGPSIFDKFLIKFSLESLLNKLFSHEVKPNLLKVIKISLKNGCSSQNSMLVENLTFPEISQNSIPIEKILFF